MYLITGLNVPEELWPDLRPDFPTFDFYGEVTIRSSVTSDYLFNGYLMYSRDKQWYKRSSTRMPERPKIGLTGSVLIPLSSVPESLANIIDQVILREMKIELDHTKNLRYADMDELSFNRKDL